MLFTLELRAQTGAVDTNFSPNANSTVYGSAIQPDGKILVSGNFTLIGSQTRNRIARFNADGTVEATNTFNLGTGFNNGAYNAAVQADGKILVTGFFNLFGSTSRNYIARLNADGTLDSSFNPNPNGTVYGAVVQPDGKILVCGDFFNIGGQARNRIARLLPSGTADTNFNPNANGSVYGIALQTDGKIIIVGDFTTLSGGAAARNRIARLNADGSVEATNTFNIGTGSASIVHCTAVQSDGKILIGGAFSAVNGQTRNRIARLLPDGNVEATNTFNPGSGGTGNIYNCVVQTDGKIVIAGAFTSFNALTRNRIARLNADGTLESTFDPNASGEVDSTIVQADGKILMGGFFNTVGVAARTNIARLTNSVATQSLTATTANRIEWLRGGSSTEAQDVAFDFSTDGGASWISLGFGTRISGGWELTGFTLPASGQIRGRARVPGGYYNGSSGLMETTAAFSGFVASAPLVTTIAATNITDVIATLNGGVNPAGSGTTAWFEYGMTTNYGSVAGVTLSPTNGATTQSISVIVSNLTQGTTYNFRAAASNDVGVMYGTNLTFTTLLYPDIAVEQPAGTGLIDGVGTNNFGASLVGTTNAPRTFIIRNTGFTNLTGLVITKDGTNAADFNLDTNAMNTTLPPGASTTFNVVFVTGSTGSRTASLHIASNDPDESQFDINLLGVGYRPGDLETNFNPSANNTVYSTAVQPDGKLLVGGSFTSIANSNRNYFVRLNADGTLETNFNPLVNSTVYAVALQNDGKILIGGDFGLVGGQTRSRIARLHPDGSLDTNFNPNASSSVYNLLVQPDGKILVGGGFGLMGNVTRSRMARINADGTLDLSFSNSVSLTVYTMALQPDGKIIIGGDFGSINGVTRSYIARVTTNGTLDTSFTNTVNGTVYSVSLQLDGKLMVGGTFTTANGVTRNRFARFNIDGTLDSLDLNAGNTVFSIVSQADGKIIAGGNFTSLSNGVVIRNYIARLNANGTLDTNFNPSANSTVYSVAQNVDGTVVAGGAFTTMGGFTRNRIARLLNDPVTQSFTVPSASRVEWLRGGASPEISRPTFDFSTDGGLNWVSLGTVASISGGWEVTGLSLPASGQMRARGRLLGGVYNASAGFVETNVAFSGFVNAAPVVTTIPASSVNVITATINASINPSGFATTAQFEYGTTTNYGSVINITLSPANGATTQSVSAGLTNLVGGTTYHFRAIASNSVGMTFGSNVTFTTLMQSEIVVEQPAGTNLSDGLSTVTLPLAIVSNAGPAQTFVIRNLGVLDLTGLAITKDGTHSNDFILDTNSMLGTVAPGASTTFSITFLPTASGTRTAAIHIANNDSDENPFDIALTATAARPGDVDSLFAPSSDSFVRHTAVQVDGKILMNGSFTAVNGILRTNIARLHADGSVDTNFNLMVDSSVDAIALEPNHKILLGGFFTNISAQARTRIARINVDGSADAALNSGANSSVSSIVPQPDGKLILCGNFTNVANTARNRMARLNTDGSVDSFNPNPDSNPLGAFVLPDGKIIVWGNFQIIGSMARNRFARLNADGSTDGSFNAGNDGSVYCATLQPDGKILIGGSFTTVGGSPRANFARLNPDGTPDPGFTPNPNAAVSSIALQTDGKIIIGGDFTTVASATRNFIARLNTNGSIDSGFTVASGSAVSGLTIQPDGKILVSGNFTTMGGAGRNRIARLVNDSVSQTLNVVSADRVEWLRSGAMPEAQRVSFDVSFDGGTSWSPLGAGLRIPGGWELTNIALPPSGQLRAQAFVTVGMNNAASYLHEATNSFSGLLAPEIAVQQPPGANVADNSTKDFGTVPLSNNLSLTFTITNLGTTNLTGIVITKNGTHAADFTVDTNGTSTVLPPGTSTSFSVTFAPSALGARTAAIHIANNDADENPFDINLTGTGAAPEIVVEQPEGTSLTAGATTIDFGGVTIGVSSAAKIFFIRNNGGATLSGLAVTKDGTHSSDFSVDTTGMSTTLAPGENTFFSVTFTPSAASTRNAAIHIASNDADENPFDINLTGTGANQSPVVANPIPDQTATTGIAFTYMFPLDTFSDPDAVQTLTYTATKTNNSALPAWLTFTPGTRTFSGTPGPGDVGTLYVKVTATDNGTPNLSVSDEFAIVVITPPSVTTLSAVGVGPYGATLRSTINPNGLPTTAYFQYGEDTNYGLTEDISLSPNDGAVAQSGDVAVSGLQPNTTYHFRARASNSAGTTLGGDLTFMTPSPPVSNWRPAGFGSDGRALYGTYFANTTEGWAVGPGGAIRHTIDSGVTWEDQLIGAPHLYAVGGSDALHVWTVGDGGFISMWDGLVWSPQGSGVSATLRTVWAADGNNAWAVGDGGTLLRWNGSVWNSESAGGGQSLFGVWGTDANNVWVVGAAGLVLRWNGSTWTTSNVGTSQDLYCIHGSGPNNIWVAGTAGTMFKWNGFTWSTHNSGTGETLYEVYVADANNAWAAGGRWLGYAPGIGVVVKWNGSSWNAQPTFPETLYSISGANANNVWAVGESGLITKWNGSSWTTQSHGARGFLLAVWGVDANNIWAVGGYNSIITKWNGASWTQQPSPVIYRLWGVWGADVNNVWAVGEYGTILKWNGSTWTTNASGTSADLWGIWGRDVNNVWAVGNFGTILKWNGSSWITQSSPPGVPLRSVWGTDVNNVWAAGNSGVIRKYNGTSWSPLNTTFNQNDLVSIWVGAANNIWIGGFNGTRYNWNGSTWVSYYQPGGNFVYGFWGTNPNNVWCVAGGGIQRWNGASWTAEPANINPWAFWGTGPGSVYVVGNDGMIRINADYRPTLVATYAASAITSSGATLNGAFNAGGRPGTAVFQYGQDLRYGANTIVPLSPNNGTTTLNVSATIGGLAPSTSYRFRIVGANGFGRANGNDLGFTTLAGPDIAVEQPAGNSLMGGTSTVNLTVGVGEPAVIKTFTVRNTGTLNLTGLAITKDGPDATDFTVGALGLTTLAPGTSTTFDVSFSASIPTEKTAALHITSNDPDESPFDINLTGSGVIPEIAVQQPAFNDLTDNSSTVAFGEATLGQSIVKAFTVTNLGRANLAISSITVDGTDAALFTVGLNSTNIPPTGFVTFNVMFSPTTLGAKSAALHIANNDADENPFDISLTGTGTSPEIVVEQPVGTVLDDEFAFVQFGGAYLGNSVTKTFTVRNTGIGSLLGLSITKENYGGGNDVHFNVGAFTSSIPPGASATFDVTFAPTGPYTHTAVLHIFSTDADESPFDIYIQGDGMQPEIAVEQPTGTNLVDEVATIDYGDVVLGAPVTKTFTVRSVGVTYLGSLSVFKDGANPEHFQLTTLPAFISSGTNATFNVTFNPTNAGSKSANIHITSNDQDENPFDIVVTGNAVAPEIVVEQPAGTNLENHDARAFGTVTSGSDSTLVFAIRNTGVGNLLGLGITFTGANAADFSVSASPTAPVAPGGSTTFTVRFAPSTSGTKTAALRIANNDENENPFEINLSGTCLAPEIVVRQPISTDIADGGSKNFGSVLVSTATNLTFTISNIGNANLTGLGITIDGTDAPDFSVVSNPVAPVIPGGSTSFTVRFAPLSGGAKTAVLHIANNDPDENLFDITLNGTAIANTPPTLTRANANVAVPVNTLATNNGTFSDVDGDSVTISASVGTITQGAGTWGWAYTPGTVGSQTVTITANDGHPGGTNAVTFMLTANDVTPPTAAFVPVTPDPRTNAAGTIILNFSENVSGVDTNDFTLTRDGSPVSLGGLVVTQINAASYSFDLTAFTATPGSYVLTLVSLGSGIADSSSNPLAGDASDAFDVASASSTVTNGNLSVSNAPSGGDMGLTLRIVNIGGTNYLEIHDANNAIAAGSGTTQVDANTIRVPAASVTNELQITGGSGDDHFVFDASNGCPLPPGGVNIDGGGQTLNGGDTLQIIGVFSSVQYDANDIGGGNLQDDCSTVNFSGFEPVDYTMATIGNLAINVDPLNLFGGPVLTTLSILPGAGNEAKTRVNFSSGLELMDFGTLTGTLTVTGDSGEADTIVVQGVGTNFAGHLTIAAQAADSIVLTNTTLALATGKNFDVTAGSVTIGAATVSGGTVAFHGGSIAMNISATNQHSRLTVDGGVVLSSSPALNLTGSYAPQPGDTFTLIDNDGTDAVVGSFAGLAEGANFSFNGVTVRITYTGGSGNDVVVSAATPPTLPAQSDRTIAELTLLTVTNTALNPVLNYRLVSPPTGANIDSNGVITWTPSEAQGPGTHTLTTVATNASGLSTTNSFVVSVTEVNLAPSVNALSNRTVNPGQTIILTATATDPDQPANTLSFSLVSPPSGATLNSSGAFQWRPTVAQRDSTNVVRVRVLDNGSPALSATNEFTVIVNPLASVVLTSITYSEFDVTGTIGPDYIIMATQDLLDWTDIATNLSPVVPFRFNDTNAVAFSNRVYKVRLAP